jgi:transcriptional regulator with XRE-family HTH domain
MDSRDYPHLESGRELASSGGAIEDGATQKIGLKIRMLRHSAGLSLREISHAVGVSIVQFHRYETGASALSTVRLVAIAKVLGVRAASLIGAQTVTEPERLAGRRQEESREVSRLFATLSKPASRLAVLLYIRAAAAREDLFEAHAELLSPGGFIALDPVPTEADP